MNTKEIGIGLLGMGTVGGGVARVLREKGEILVGQAGCRLVLRKALVRTWAAVRYHQPGPAHAEAGGGHRTPRR